MSSQSPNDPQKDHGETSAATSSDDGNTFKKPDETESTPQDSTCAKNESPVNRLNSTDETTRASQQSNPAASTMDSIHLNENWGIFYERLVKYKQTHGHCIIPQSYAEEDPELVQWVFEQRVKGQAKLSKHKVALLDSITFEWYPPESNDQDKWQSMYNYLLEYKKEHGDCLVPQRYPDDPKLGRWVNKQRENKDRLPPERRKLLDDIHFTWRVVKREPWDTMFHRLLEYKRQFGDCLVPQRYKKDPRLGGWVREQRKRQRLMPEERRQKLNALAFTWKAKQDRPDPHNNNTNNNETLSLQQQQEEDGTTMENTTTIAPVPANVVQHHQGVAPEYPTISLNMSNNSGLGIAALSSQQQQQPNLTTSAGSAPLSASHPQNHLIGTTSIGPVVPVVNPLVASAAMIPSLQAHQNTAFAQCNWILASQQGQQIAAEHHHHHQVSQIGLHQRQMLHHQARAGLGLLYLRGGEAAPPPFFGQFVPTVQPVTVPSAGGVSSGGNMMTILQDATPMVPQSTTTTTTNTTTPQNAARQQTSSDLLLLPNQDKDDRRRGIRAPANQD